MTGSLGITPLDQESRTTGATSLHTATGAVTLAEPLLLSTVSMTVKVPRAA